MALLDFLKKKEESEKAKKNKKPAVKKAGEVKVEKKTEAPVKAKPSVKAGRFDYEAVREPHISEKSTYSAEENRYVFKVSPNYNKNQIKSAVEGIYGVNVLAVNIIKIPQKKRRVGKTQGFKKGLVKAVVKIKEGQKIEIL